MRRVISSSKRKPRGESGRILPYLIVMTELLKLQKRGQFPDEPSCKNKILINSLWSLPDVLAIAGIKEIALGGLLYYSQCDTELLPKRSWAMRRSRTNCTGPAAFARYPASSTSPQYRPRFLTTCCVLTLCVVRKRSASWSTAQSWAFLAPEWAVARYRYRDDRPVCLSQTSDNHKQQEASPQSLGSERP